MQKIIISTESTADIPSAIAQSLDIAILPISILAGGKEYLDGISFTPEEFYRMLEECEALPSTAQVAPIAFMELYEKSWREGFSHQIHIAINGKGSGTYNNAVQAAGLFYEEHPEAKDAFSIHVIDSANYSMVYGWTVIEAARMAKKGADAEEIIAACEDIIRHTKVFLVPMNLKFIKKSGRISGLAGFVGDALGLKPVITFENGESKTIAKIRGEKKLINEVITMCSECMPEDAPYLIAYGSNEDLRRQFRSACTDCFGREPEIEYPIGSVIAINSGHDMLGIIFRNR